MIMLCLGVALFAVLHLFRRLLPGVYAGLPALPRKIAVAVGLIASIYLITLGWAEASTHALWQAPDFMRGVMVIAMLPVFILYMGSYPGSALRAWVRHPQLLGFKLWAVLHLIVNGEVRTVILFGGFLIWAVVQMILINRATGKPPLPASSDRLVVAWAAIPIGIAAWVGLLLAHEWLFGVSPLG